MDAAAAGCDRVLNLAAGLDTRPYRLDLPAEFTWVEGDLPGLIAEKEELLAGETPRCRLTRHPVDLAGPGLMQWMNENTGGPLRNAPFKFACPTASDTSSSSVGAQSKWNRCSSWRTVCAGCRGCCDWSRGCRSPIRTVLPGTDPGALWSASYPGEMLLFFGYGTKQKHLGPGQVRTCPRCHNTTQWNRMREFKQLTLFFVPVARWKRRVFEVCGVCGTAVAA